MAINGQHQRNDVGEQNMEENMEENTEENTEEKRLRFYNTQDIWRWPAAQEVHSEEVALTAVGCLWFCGITWDKKKSRDLLGF
jgi:hypothetical protein